MHRIRELGNKHREFKGKIGDVMQIRDSEHRVKVLNAREPVLVYAAKNREDHDSTHVIVGTFTINLVPYFTLIDNGSTH